jgi:hypothetical protein
MIRAWVSPPVVLRQPLFKKAGSAIDEGPVQAVEVLIDDMVAVNELVSVDMVAVKKQRDHVKKQRDDTTNNQEKRVSKTLGRLMYY